MVGTWECGSKGLKMVGWMFCPVVFGSGSLLSGPHGPDMFGLYAIGSGIDRINDTLYWRGGRSYIKKRKCR